VDVCTQDNSPSWGHSVCPCRVDQMASPWLVPLRSHPGCPQRRTGKTNNAKGCVNAARSEGQHGCLPTMILPLQTKALWNTDTGIHPEVGPLLERTLCSSCTDSSKERGWSSINPLLLSSAADLPLAFSCGR